MAYIKTFESYVKEGYPYSYSNEIQTRKIEKNSIIDEDLKRYMEALNKEYGDSITFGRKNDEIVFYINGNESPIFLEGSTNMDEYILSIDSQSASFRFDDIEEFMNNFKFYYDIIGKKKEVDHQPDHQPTSNEYINNLTARQKHYHSR